MFIRVGPIKLRFTVVWGAENVIIGKEMIKPQLFGREADTMHRHGVTPQLGLWVYHPDFHVSLPIYCFENI